MGVVPNSEGSSSVGNSCVAAVSLQLGCAQDPQPYMCSVKSSAAEVALVQTCMQCFCKTCTC